MILVAEDLIKIIQNAEIGKIKTWTVTNKVEMDPYYSDSKMTVDCQKKYTVKCDFDSHLIFF